VTPSSPPLVADSAVDAVTPVPGRGRYLVEVVDRPDDDAICALASFATIADPHDIALVADGAANQVPTSTDDAGFTFEDDGTVTVFDALDRAARISGASFRRLVARVLDVVLAEGAERGDPEAAAVLAEIAETRRALAGPA
jgi:hypothetical protein